MSKKPRTKLEIIRQSKPYRRTAKDEKRDRERVKEILSEIEQFIEQRAELAGDGDSTIERAILEVAEFANTDAFQLWEANPAMFRRLVVAACRKKRKWLTFATGDSYRNRSTLKAHAEDRSKPWIEKICHGNWRCWESRRADYLNPKND